MRATKGSDGAYPGLELLADGVFVTKAYGRWITGDQPFSRASLAATNPLKCFFLRSLRLLL